MSNNSYKTILVEIKNNVCTITLNRPDKKNAINSTLADELKKIFEFLKFDKDTKVVILQGAGDTFCSGADLEYLNKLKDYSFDENLQDSKSLAELFLKIYEFPKPTIAKVQGAALAGGCGLSTVCDFVFATENAKFGYPEVKIGFLAAIVSIFLIRQIGERKAKDLLLTGRLLTAKEGTSFGLINKVLSNNEIDTYIQNFVDLLKRNSIQSLSATKNLLGSLGFSTPSEEMTKLAELNAGFRKNEDFSEGLKSFLEKRKPNWIQ